MSFVAGAVGLVGAGTSLYLGMHQQHLAKEAAKNAQQQETYSESPYAKDQLNLAQMLFNGRMAGAGPMEQNINNSQANFTNNVNRNATSGGQALALAGEGQVNANNAYSDLATREAGNRYNLLQNLNAGYQTMIGEGDKTYNSENQKALYDAGQVQDLRNAGWQNIFSGVSGAASSVAQGVQNQQQDKFNKDYLDMVKRMYK